MNPFADLPAPTSRAQRREGSRRLLQDLGLADCDVSAVAGLHLERSHSAEIAMFPAYLATVVIGAKFGGVPWRPVVMSLLVGLACAAAFGAAALLRRPAVRVLDAGAVASSPVQEAGRSLLGRAVMILSVTFVMSWHLPDDFIWFPLTFPAVFGAGPWALQIARRWLETRLGVRLYVKQGTSRPFYRLAGGVTPQ